MMILSKKFIFFYSSIPLPYLLLFRAQTYLQTMPYSEWTRIPPCVELNLFQVGPS